MTDREILDLAATAAIGAGMNLSQHHGIWYDSDYDNEWSPIRDDGDAFRLAVKLNLFDENAKFTYGLAVAMNEFSEPCEATRRAIVRAAAELGRKPTDGATPVK